MEEDDFINLQLKAKADTKESDRLGCSADSKFKVVKQKEPLSQRDEYSYWVGACY